MSTTTRARLTRPDIFVPLSVRFVTGKTGSKLMERFGRDGPFVWAAYLAACKINRPEGEISYASEAEGWALLGLAQHRPDFTLDDFFTFTGRLKKTRRTRIGRIVKTQNTVWGRWSQANERDAARKRKSRSRAQSDRDMPVTPTVTPLGHDRDLEVELEVEKDIYPPYPPEGGTPTNGTRRTTEDRQGDRFTAKLTQASRDLWECLSEDGQAEAVQLYQRVTGLKWVRGTHGASWRADPLGTDQKPTGYEAQQIPPTYHGKPTPAEFLNAYIDRV